MTARPALPLDRDNVTSTDVATARRIFAYIDSRDQVGVPAMALRMARGGDFEMLKIMREADFARSSTPTGSSTAPANNALACAAVPLLHTVGDSEEVRQFLDGWIRKFAGMESREHLPLATLCLETVEEDVARGMLLLGASPHALFKTGESRVTALGKAFSDGNGAVCIPMLVQLMERDQIPLVSDKRSLVGRLLDESLALGERSLANKIVDHWLENGVSEKYALRIGKSLLSVTGKTTGKTNDKGVRARPLVTENLMLRLLLLAKMEKPEDWVQLLQQGKTTQSFLTDLVTKTDSGLRERVLLHLLDQGVSIDAPLAKMPTGAGNATRPCTMLALAVFEDDSELAGWLLERGADPSIPIKVGRETHTVATMPVANGKAQAVVKSWLARQAIFNTVAAAKQNAPGA